MQVTQEHFRSERLPALIQGMYNRHISDPQTLLEVCRFQEIGQHTSIFRETETRALRAVMFERRFRRYILGSGHPEHPNFAETGLVLPEEILRVRDDRLLRARLFLRAVTDSEILPMIRDFHIQVRSTYL